jgi:hypothetical protein
VLDEGILQAVLAADLASMGREAYDEQCRLWAGRFGIKDWRMLIYWRPFSLDNDPCHIRALQQLATLRKSERWLRPARPAGACACQGIWLPAPARGGLGARPPGSHSRFREAVSNLVCCLPLDFLGTEFKSPAVVPAAVHLHVPVCAAEVARPVLKRLTNHNTVLGTDIDSSARAVPCSESADKFAIVRRCRGGCPLSGMRLHCHPTFVGHGFDTRPDARGHLAISLGFSASGLGAVGL